MDALADLLDVVRARTAAFCHTVLEPPWALRIADEAPLALATALRGHAWIVPDDEEPTLVRTGDVAVIKGPGHYTVSDHPDTPPSVVVHAGNRLTTIDGADLDATDDATTAAAGMRPSPYASALGHPAGGIPDGAALVASGVYQVTGDVSGRLLAALPRVVHLPAADAASPILQLLATEVDQAQPGQQVMLDRLLDLALVSTLRAWLNRPDADAPGWYRAHADPIVGPALRSMHDEPAHPWTVATLATERGSVPRRVRPPVHRSDRPTAADLPHPLAPRPRRRPAPRHRRQHRVHRPRRRLRQRLRPHRRLQARPRPHPPPTPHPPPHRGPPRRRVSVDRQRR